MSPPRVLTALLICIGLYFTACTKVPIKKEIQDKKEDNKNNVFRRDISIIGKVRSINTDENFVLINLTSPEIAANYTVFHIETKSRSAVLTPTGERVKNLLAADITNGDPKVGDTVVVIVSLRNTGSNEKLTPLNSPSPFLESLPDVSLPEEPESEEPPISE